MAVTIAPSFTVRANFWTTWKALLATKAGVHQYDDDGTVYTIWFYDGAEAYVCTIWQNLVPDGVVAEGYTQEQNDADKTDFTTNYLASANKRISLTEIRGITPTLQGRFPTAATRPVSPKLTFITPNWCDKTTWYGGSAESADEVATDSGDHTTYSLAHEYVIDAYHGKITFEDQLKDDDGRSFRVLVKVNGTVKTEQDPHLSAGGDYTINYAAGEITFLTALQPTDVVTATYHYAQRATFVIKPAAGKRLYIGSVEVQFSDDIVMNDTFVFQAYGLVDVFAPQLMQPPYNFPSGTKIPLGDPLVYKTMNDLLNDSNGAYPGYPQFGGSNWRALKRQAYIFVWDYTVGTTCLEAAYGMEIHIDLEHDAPCGGTFGVATLYCTSEDEA
jgi:hypothetical protein